MLVIQYCEQRGDKHMNNKFTMELVWHNCLTYPPKEYWNDNLYVTDGTCVHSVKYNKEHGWWSRTTGDYLPFDLLWEYWWADIEQTVKCEPRFVEGKWDIKNPALDVRTSSISTGTHWGLGR